MWPKWSKEKGVYCFTLVCLSVRPSVLLSVRNKKILSHISQQLFNTDALNFNTLFVYTLRTHKVLKFGLNRLICNITIKSLCYKEAQCLALESLKKIWKSFYKKMNSTTLSKYFVYDSVKLILFLLWAMWSYALTDSVLYFSQFVNCLNKRSLIID